MPAEITLSACKYFSVKSKQGYMNGCFYAFDRRLPAGPCKPGCYLYKVMSSSKLALRTHGSNMPELGPHQAGA